MMYTFKFIVWTWQSFQTLISSIKEVQSGRFNSTMVVELSFCDFLREFITASNCLGHFNDKEIVSMIVLVTYSLTYNLCWAHKVVKKPKLVKQRKLYRDSEWFGTGPDTSVVYGLRTNGYGWRNTFVITFWSTPPTFFVCHSLTAQPHKAACLSVLFFSSI